MNAPNSITKNWFTALKMSTLTTADYDSIWEYRDFEFGVQVSKGRVTIHIFDSKRFRNPEKRNHVGTFAFHKKTLGNHFTWRVETAALQKKYQGNGIGPAVYEMLSLNGYPIQSGASMSTGAAKLWARLADSKRLEVQTFSKGKWHLLENITAPDIYSENKLVLFPR